MVRRIVPTSVDEREITLRALEATPATLPALLRNVTEAQVRTQGQAPDSWAIAEVVSHLIDGENRTFERTRRMVDETNPFLPVYPDDDYSKLPLGELIEKFRVLRAAHTEFLRGLSQSDWADPGRHELYGDVTIGFLARSTVCHDAEHLVQISRKLVSGG
jgi:hypothetical protein